MEAPDIEHVMNKFHAEIGTDKLRWLMDQFSGERSITELFRILWDMEEAHQYLSPVLSKPQKSESEAEKLRNEGNQFYKKRNLDKALELYNRSISFAPHPEISNVSSLKSKMKEKSMDKEERPVQEYTALSLGYANRSAVLLEMQLYEKCIEDINLALLHGYPEASRSKLEDRKQKCHSGKNNQEDFQSESGQSSRDIVLSSCKRQRIPKVTEPNPCLPSFSSSVRVVFSPDKGRHVIAERDIRPGDVIAVEECYCSSLTFQQMTMYCSNCLTPCLTPIPCPWCTTVVFCSEACREKAVKGDHWLECPILPTLNALGLRPTFTMVYKLLKHSSYIKWKTALEGLQEQERQIPPEKHGQNEEGVYSPDDYESIYHLLTNKEKRTNGDLYVKCLITFVLTQLLKQGERYFVDFFGKPFNPGKEDLLGTGGTLFSNLMKISCNGFQLIEFQCTGPPIALKRVEIGSAIFPTLSLLNHSCDPSATAYVYGRHQVLRAVRCIPAGDEITGSYCKTFYMEGPEERQVGLLEVYQFTCNCEACQKNWSTYHNLPKTAQYKCIDCARPVSTEQPQCQNCKLDYTKKDYEADKQQVVDDWWETVKSVETAFEKSRHIVQRVKTSHQPMTEEDLEVIRDAVEKLDHHVRCPCKPLWEAYDAMDLYFRLEGSPKFSSSSEQGESSN